MILFRDKALIQESCLVVVFWSDKQEQVRKLGRRNLWQNSFEGGAQHHRQPWGGFRGWAGQDLQDDGEHQSLGCSLSLTMTTTMMTMTMIILRVIQGILLTTTTQMNWISIVRMNIERVRKKVRATQRIIIQQRLKILGHPAKPILVIKQKYLGSILLTLSHWQRRKQGNYKWNGWKGMFCLRLKLFTWHVVKQPFFCLK